MRPIAPNDMFLLPRASKEEEEEEEEESLCRFGNGLGVGKSKEKVYRKFLRKRMQNKIRREIAAHEFYIFSGDVGFKNERGRRKKTLLAWSSYVRSFGAIKV